MWFKDDQIIITIYNYGQVSCKVISVFINGGQCSIDHPAEGYVTIPVEERDTIIVNFSSNGSSLNLKLLTERGYTVEREYEAP